MKPRKTVAQVGNGTKIKATMMRKIRIHATMNHSASSSVFAIREPNRKRTSDAKNVM